MRVKKFSKSEGTADLFLCPFFYSSPTLFTGNADECPSPPPQPEVTSSSCGSLLHFEIIPPTPKESTSSANVDSCFNFDLSTKNEVVHTKTSQHLRVDELTLADISSDNDDDEMEDELRTPKVFFSGPMFLMPEIRDPDLSCQEVKDRVEKALQDSANGPANSGSTYLQVPMNVPRRRHSWICG